MNPFADPCKKLTRNEMKIKLMLMPIKTVLSAGTYQGTLVYCPVHPNQKMPMTRHGPPIIAPMSLFSGGGNPLHFLMSSG